MAKLSGYRYKLLYHILSSIIACEGGSIVGMSTIAGRTTTIYIKPDIPPEHWCSKCKKRAICKAKLINRWSGIVQQQR